MTDPTPADSAGAFTHLQVTQLLAAINPARVLQDGKGHSHVSQQDVTAHLIRVFGFGGFDVETLNVECVFETTRDDAGRRWDVCYRALVRLTIRDAAGREVAHYDDGSTATAQNQTRGDGHDLAYKSALSLAKKRAAINLGDQFGLSLYNRGQLEQLVRGTLVRPPVPTADSGGPGSMDMQEGVPQQLELGNDETPPPAESEQQTRDEQTVPRVEPAALYADAMATTDHVLLNSLVRRMAEAGLQDHVIPGGPNAGRTLGDVLQERLESAVVEADAAEPAPARLCSGKRREDGHLCSKPVGHTGPHSYDRPAADA